MWNCRLKAVNSYEPRGKGDSEYDNVMHLLKRIVLLFWLKQTAVAETVWTVWKRAARVRHHLLSAVILLPLITCQSMRHRDYLFCSAATGNFSLTLLFKSTINTYSGIRKRMNRKWAENTEWKLIAWHKNASYSPTVLLQRRLNPAFKPRRIATSSVCRESAS